MKLTDILLSAILHACIVGGAVYGLVCFREEKENSVDAEPIFFEILEESEIAAASESEIGQQTDELPAEFQKPVSEEEIFAGEEPATDVPALEEAHVPEEDNAEDEPAAVRNEPPEVGLEPDPMPDSAPDADTEQAAASELQDGPSSEISESDEPSVVAANQEQSKIVSDPKALNRIVPVYPRSARKRGREGLVTLEVAVSDLGEVFGTEVVVSSGHRDLDSAAVSAVRSARFSPATEDGVSIRGKVRLTFEFKLR